MKVDFHSPTPLHHQISQCIEQEILQGKYVEKIPSERELMDRFSVSRTTIREAIARMVNDGILVKIHGKGTFISREPPVQDWLNSLNSFTEVVKQMGMTPTSRLLYHGTSSTPKKIADVLEVPSFYTIERLRYANEIPVAIEQHYYKPNIGIELSRFDLHTAVIYELLEHSLGIPLWEAEQTITSRHATKKESVYLSIPADACILSVERIIRDESGHIIEFYKGVYRPDMYQFRINTKRTRK